MAASNAKLASIYAVLFSRGDGTFHWTICIPVDDHNALKMHATNAQGGWVYEKRMHNSLLSRTACGAVEIGRLSSTADIDRVSSLLQSVPMSIPAVDQAIEQRFTCRVWFKAAVRALAANNIIVCSDVVALEREVKAFGDKQDPNTINGAQIVFHKSAITSV